jgi:hypothetical protein
MDTQRTTLATGPQSIDFMGRGERFTSYLYGGDIPGFSALHTPEGRAVTQADSTHGLSVWLQHGNVNGVAFGIEDPPLPHSGESDAHTSRQQGRIVSREIMARRGSQSVGFRHTCDWRTADGRCLLTDVRTVRISPGPSEGQILDFTFVLQAPEDTSVTLGRTEQAFLCVRATATLCPIGGGQIRNSTGEYGVQAIHGRKAAWCSCVGVVQGETVGFVLMDHPETPWHPTTWIVRTDGLISPSPFAWHEAILAPDRSIAFRYRLLTHRGYVDQGWVEARMAEFAATSSPHG